MYIAAVALLGLLVAIVYFGNTALIVLENPKPEHQSWHHGPRPGGTREAAPDQGIQLPEPTRGWRASWVATAFTA